MDVSIIIVNYKTAQSALATVDSIYRFTQDITFEIIVADNASGDVDCQLLHSDKRIRVIELPSNLGFGRANNVASQCATGKYLFFLNPDTLLLNNAVKILAKYLDQHAQTGIVGGNLYDAQGQPTHSYHRLQPGILSELDFACGQFIRKLLYGKNAQFNHTTLPINVAMITGADLMIRRDIFNQIGGFDEQFFMYNEDADLCLRISQIGYQITNIPSAHITHLEGQSSADKLQRTQMIMNGRNTYLHKHHSIRYCEWANRLFRITHTLASVIYRLAGNTEKEQLYLHRKQCCISSAPLLVNARFLLRKPTGVEQYAINMVRTLHNLGVSVQLICPRIGTISSQYDLTNIRILRRGFTNGHIWEQVFLPWYRLWHHEGHFITFCGLGSILCSNEIMTIHDLSFLENPQWFSRAYALVYRFLTPLAARSARAILTVSNYSYSQIVKAYPWAAKKLHVVRCATPNEYKSFIHKDTPYQEYLLAVASIDPRKNINSIIQVMQQHPEWQLKIVGCFSHVFASSSNLQIPSNVEMLGYVDNEELIHLYEHALAFIFPSLYEGFGIPPLEAMAVGCPVLCSDIPVLREVLDDVPLYFQPLDLADIARAIQQLQNVSATERTQMIQRGYDQVNKYSWEQSAQTLIDLLYTP